MMQIPQPPAQGNPLVSAPPQMQSPAPVESKPTLDLSIEKILQSTNLAKDMDEKELDDIGRVVHEGYRMDKESRSDWETQVDTWTKMALQAKENKTWPWEKASNVKFPLLSVAAMQFSARAYPSLVPSDGKIVQVRVIGRDPQGQKTNRAARVGEFMSWQLMEEMKDWEDEMDKLLVILPIVGTCFKKTYWDSVNKVNCSTLILPKDLVVNYWAKTLESAERKTEIIMMSPRVLKERMLSEVFLDVKLPDPQIKPREMATDEVMRTRAPATTDTSTPYTILEQHTFLDLDDDGYPEPYIVTIEEESKKVLRIVARFSQKDVKRNSKQEIIKIEPTEYYTKYGFIPNPDGGFYDVGFGLLLGSINESINTLVNQLVDSGTINNLQSGFLSKTLRLKLGDTRFKPGEWKMVNASGEVLKNSVVPLPTKEPSNVLLQLFQLLVTSGKELASISEIFVGKMPGQNTPATTTMATVEQGMKLFTAIYKRIYKALTTEFEKLYALNSIYLDEDQAARILDEPITLKDFDMETYDICPAADPTAFSSTQKLLKAQALMELIPLGTVNPQEVTKRILEAQEQPNIEQLMVQPQQQQPDPKVVAIQEKSKADTLAAQVKTQAMQQKAELDKRSAEQKQAQSADEHQINMLAKAQMAKLDLTSKEMTHAQRLAQAREQHSERMSQQKANKNKDK